jgi:hypothetical protein
VSAETEHRLHHVKRQAHGTGEHIHHRGQIEHGGLRQAYWRCALADGGPCPSDPDPWVLLQAKAEARPKPQRVARLRGGDTFCPGGHLPGPRDSEGRCVECRREQLREAARKYRQRHRAA